MAHGKQQSMRIRRRASLRRDVGSGGATVRQIHAP
jgi:hypothetical protein